MAYTTTISKKGQITIPKALREFLELKGTPRIILEPERKEKKKKIIKIKLVEDILDLAGTFKPKKIKNAVNFRKEMTTMYKTR